MAVNEQEVIKGVRSLKVEGGSDGLIQVFDVYLTNFYTDFWNDFSFGFRCGKRSKLSKIPHSNPAI